MFPSTNRNILKQPVATGHIIKMSVIHMKVERNQNLLVSSNVTFLKILHKNISMVRDCDIGGFVKNDLERKEYCVETFHILVKMGQNIKYMYIPFLPEILSTSCHICRSRFYIVTYLLLDCFFYFALYEMYFIVLLLVT